MSLMINARTYFHALTHIVKFYSCKNISEHFVLEIKFTCIFTTFFWLSGQNSDGWAASPPSPISRLELHTLIITKSNTLFLDDIPLMQMDPGDKGDIHR